MNTHHQSQPLRPDIASGNESMNTTITTTEIKDSVEKTERTGQLLHRLARHVLTVVRIYIQVLRLSSRKQPQNLSPNGKPSRLNQNASDVG